MNVEIIAEIANAHQGKKEVAVDIARQSVSNGADIVKFQMYTADDLLVPNHERYLHFKKQSFSISDWDFIFGALSNVKTKIFVDVFGLESFKISKKYDIAGYKIHFSDLMNTPLLKLVASTGKELLIGSGGASLKEIHYAIKILKQNGVSKQKIVLLHGFQGYPTRIDDTNLERLKEFKREFKGYADLGISDHIAGDDVFSKIIPMMALPYGISFVEKHVTINREQKGVDYYSSLDVKEFKDFVEKFRKAELSLGSEKCYSDQELNYRKQVKKKWLAKNNLAKGTIITDDNIIMKRDDSVIQTLEYSEIIGKELIQNVEENSVIVDDFLK